MDADLASLLLCMALASLFKKARHLPLCFRSRAGKLSSILIPFAFCVISEVISGSYNCEITQTLRAGALCRLRPVLVEKLEILSPVAIATCASAIAEACKIPHSKAFPESELSNAWNGKFCGDRISNF
ncbi:hypothetical protein [Bacillus sp. MRMR6]|uniref:hypothetical protein n=1 Tax=Bacillus sp. MRMR6 TaxID=1928617 RepID=UPI0009520CA5|nr:hypothetical protein [Bacillus sp. MRMR6]OLS41187.1 hypothetical protein BTR25_04800 [Bacillus sp. MRMR6]